ncbi:hypothetical protein FACS189418_7220 [Clostridia bacterium]|nr:hypothetical protein FACS189418_7220 [Clostridia bacterium]
MKFVDKSKAFSIEKGVTRGHSLLGYVSPLSPGSLSFSRFGAGLRLEPIFISHVWENSGLFFFLLDMNFF